MDILANATLPRLSMFSVAGWLRGRSRVDAVSAVMSSVRLRSRGLGQTMETLSGGNQQKVVLARWLTGEVKVLLLDEPTRGVDVGARSEIYRIITELAAAGMAVIMASSDMPEILALSHRALVLKDGGIVAELDRTDLQAPTCRTASSGSRADWRRRTPAPASPPLQRTTNDRHPYRTADLHV